MAYVVKNKVSLEDYNRQNTIKNEEEDVGFFESALAGVATGLWNIPKGFVSLGAELYDLVGDTNTAKEVEQWFDEVNPFDDEAEARTVGKITTAITQLLPLGVFGAIKGAATSATFATSFGINFLILFLIPPNKKPVLPSAPIIPPRAAICL